MIKLPIHILALVLVLSMVSSCSKESSADQQESHAEAVVPVKVAPLTIGDMDRIVSANGQTEALRKETVIAPVAGTVTLLPILEGSTIEPGDTLAIIETKESQAAISGAEALVAAASTPKQKAEAARALELARANRSRAAITTRIRGVVSTRSVVEGSVVAEGAELITVVDPSSIEFVAAVPVQNLKQISLGLKAEISLPSTDAHELMARVVAVSPQSDPQSQTVRVRLEFTALQEAERRLVKEGMVGTAQIVAGVDRNVLIAPRAALLRNDETNSYSVVTVTTDSLAKSIPVSLVVMADSTAEIAGADLKAGMPVIIEGHYALPDSTRVTVK
ncbi:MAG TPA: efflux RND transporter periplasmic adaptor subunit [Candidatus Acidoferrum sp.]|nr:efflux RND transporter periplasmic adaptor subunit [Candidatus Acidoferrum sp.]